MPAGILVVVDVTGLLSFLEKRGAHGELRLSSTSGEESIVGLKAFFGAGFTKLSNQASILRFCAGISGTGSLGVMMYGTP